MILQKPFREYCESLGISYRHELGLPAYAPLPAEQLASHLSVRLLQPQEVTGIQPETTVQLLESQSWWAVSIPVGSPLIIYHPHQSTARLQSSIMHELGHIILRHVPEQVVVVSQHFSGRAYPRQEEEEAKYLGACLQITKVALDWTAQQAWTIEKAAEHFGASTQLIRFRLNMTGRGL